MNAALKDQISGLRFEAKHHREQAGRLRRYARVLKGRQDWIGALRASSSAAERTALARDCDARRVELRAQLGGAK